MKLKSLLEDNLTSKRFCLKLQTELIDSWYGDYLDYSSKVADGYIKLFITDSLNDNQDVHGYYIEIYEDICRVPNHYVNKVSGVMDQGGVLQDYEIDKRDLIIRQILKTFAFQTNGILEDLSSFDRLTNYSQTWHNTENDKFYRAKKVFRKNLKPGDFLYSKLRTVFSYGKVVSVDEWEITYLIDNTTKRTISNDKADNRFRSYYILEEV